MDATLCSSRRDDAKLDLEVNVAGSCADEEEDGDGWEAHSFGAIEFLARTGQVCFLPGNSGPPVLGKLAKSVQYAAIRYARVITTPGG